LPYVYNTLGGISLLVGDRKKAISYYEKAIEHSKKSGDVYVRGYGLSGIAEACIEDNDFEKALEYLKMALEIFEGIDVKEMIATVYRKFGIVYRHKKEWKQSKEYFKKSIEIFEKLDIPFFIGEAYYDYGLMLKEEKDCDNSRTYFNEALEIFKKLKNEIWIKKVEKELSTLS
jgi:tetratricopeptide (TPR) repeat protein